MKLRILGLEPGIFAPLFALDDAALERRRARRVIADAQPGYPCRVSLADAAPGEELVLAHYEHQPAHSPFRASHAVYVRRAARERYDRVDAVPDALRSRLLSLRAFDASGMLLAADVVEGTALERLAAELLGDARAECVHVHFARPGCYAARIERA